MKKILSLLMACVFMLTLFPVVDAVDSTSAETVSAQDGQYEQDLSGQYYNEIFGDGSPYQVASIAPAKENDGFVVSYIAETDFRS